MKTHILIVEDEVMIANVIKHYIESAGYVCAGIAVDYEEAIDILEQSRVDLALLDVNLSGQKKGPELAHYINAVYRIPILFLTAYSDRKTIEEIKTTLPFGYLKKPVEKENLLIAIELALNNFSRKQLEEIHLKIGRVSYRFIANELMYIQSEHVYVSLYFVQNKKLFLRISLTQLLAILPSHLLKQANRSFAVNPQHIDSINGDKIHIGKEEIKISPLFREHF